MSLLKAEMHTHSSEDKLDHNTFSAYDLIDRANNLKYSVVALTFHEKVYEGMGFEKAKKYALSRNILLMFHYWPLDEIFISCLGKLAE